MHTRIPPKSIETGLGKYPQIREGKPPFEKTIQFVNISNHNDTIRLRCEISASSEKENTFFFAQGSWTCYRRNYCDITAAFVLIPADNVDADLPWDAYFAIIDGLPSRILEFKFAVSCRSGESISKEDMIQNNAKREKLTDSSRRIKVMPYLYQLPGYGTKATFDRMNFASSTSNISSKKEKGYKRLVVDLLATTDEGRTVIIAKSESVKLVVRSHSKEHYTDKAKEEPPSASNTVASSSPYSFQDQYFSPSPHGLFPVQSGSTSDLFYQTSPSGSEPFPYKSEGPSSAAISDTFQYQPSPDYRFHPSPTVEYPYPSEPFGFANMTIAPPYPIMDMPLGYQQYEPGYIPGTDKYLPEGTSGYLPEPPSGSRSGYSSKPPTSGPGYLSEPPSSSGQGYLPEPLAPGPGYLSGPPSATGTGYLSEPPSASGPGSGYLPGPPSASVPSYLSEPHSGSNPNYLPGLNYLPPELDTTYLSNDLAPLAPAYISRDQATHLPTRDRLDAFFEPVNTGYDYPLNISVPLGAIDSRVDELDEEFEDKDKQV